MFQTTNQCMFMLLLVLWGFKNNKKHVQKKPAQKLTGTIANCRNDRSTRPFKPRKNLWKDPPFFMGKSTISTGPCSKTQNSLFTRGYIIYIKSPPKKMKHLPSPEKVEKQFLSRKWGSLE